MTQSNPSSGPAPFVPRELTTAEVQLRNQAQADLAIKRLHIAQQCEFERQLQSCTQPNLIPFEVAAHHFAYLPTPPLLQSFLKQSKAALEHRIPQLPPHSILPVPSQPAEGQTKPHTLTDQAMQAAEGILVSKIRPRAQKRARTVLRGIYEATYALIKARGQLSSANTYTFFTVLDVLPAAVNLSAATCERATADLREAGLIATWTSWTTAGFLSHQTGEVIQQRIKQGVWLTVSLKPREGHKAVTLTQELPKESPRDLAADRRAGNTAWQIRQEVRESISPEEGNISIYSLLKWSLPKNTHQNTVKLSDSLTSLFSPQERPEDLIWNLSALMTVAADATR